LVTDAFDSITARDVTVWQQNLPKHLSLASKRGVLVLMSKIMRHAHRSGLTQTNPMTAIVMPAMPRGHEPRFLSPSEIEKLARALDEADLLAGQVTVFCDLVRFVAWTGLRSSEVAGLQVGDVDLKRNVVAVKRTLRKCGAGGRSTRPRASVQLVRCPWRPTWLRS